MRVGACMPTSWMENIKPASSLIVKPRCGGQGNALLIWLASVVMRWRLRTKQSDMTQEEIKKKMQEGVAKLTPIVTEVSSLVADAYQEGFKTCWELLTGQKFE